MTVDNRDEPPGGRLASADVEHAFRPSGRLLAAQTALGRVIDVIAVAQTPYTPTTIDLLVRLSLAPEGSLRGVDLCRQLLKSPGYVSRVIDQAESDGLVGRRPDLNDRRAQRIALTAAGDDVLATFIPHALSVLDKTVYAVLDDDEVDTLVDLLTRVTASARDLLETSEDDPT